mgnify:FL=1
MNNILESVFNELIKKKIIIAEADEEEQTEAARPTRTTLKLPKFKISEKNWGTKVVTEDRSFIELLGSRLPGKTPLERINGAQAFLDSKNEVQTNISVGEVMANLMFLDIFASVVMDFNASVAGFLFEALFAGIFEGRQIPATEGGGESGTTDIQIKTKLGDQDYSLKLLSPGVDIKGSARDLLDGVEKNPGKKEVYLVGIKTQDGESMTIDFYEFSVGLDNWFDWVGIPELVNKKVAVTFKYLGNGQIEAEEPFKDIIAAEVRKSEGAKRRGDFDSSLKFIVNDKSGKLEAVNLRKNKFGIQHVVGGQAIPTSFLVQGETYQANDVSHPTEHVVDYMGSTNLGAFVKLYGPLIQNPPAELGGKNFVDYVTSGEYKEKPEKFFEILKQAPAFKSGGQFIIKQDYMKKMIQKNSGNEGFGGPATITLDRQKFLNTAERYTDLIGKQIFEVFTDMANLVEDVSGYYLGTDLKERFEMGMAAKDEAARLAASTEKNFKEIEVAEEIGRAHV